MRSSAAASGTTPEHTTARGGLRSAHGDRLAQAVCRAACHRKAGRATVGRSLGRRATAGGSPCAHERQGCARPGARDGSSSSLSRPPQLSGGVPARRRPRHRALAPDRRAALLCAHRRRAHGPRSARRARESATARARGAGPRRRHGRAALLRARHARRLDARRPRPARPATSRAAATGSSARRSPGPSSRSTRPPASCAPGWPARGTARSSSTALPRRRDRRHGRADRRLGRARRHRRPGLRLPHLVAYAAAMALGDSVRAHGEHIAAQARSVRIDLDALEALDPGDPPQLDPERHYLEGPAADVADYLLVLDAINFGSGWFPTLRKRTGSLGLLHRRLGARRPLARRRRLDRRAAARDAHRRGGRHPRPAPRPRAHGPLRPGAARARALPRRAPRARRRRAGAADRPSAWPSCWPAA